MGSLFERTIVEKLGARLYYQHLRISGRRAAVNWGQPRLYSDYWATPGSTSKSSQTQKRDMNNWSRSPFPLGEYNKWMWRRTPGSSSSEKQQCPSSSSTWGLSVNCVNYPWALSTLHKLTWSAEAATSHQPPVTPDCCLLSSCQVQYHHSHCFLQWKGPSSLVFWKILVCFQFYPLLTQEIFHLPQFQLLSSWTLRAACKHFCWLLLVADSLL